jgi:REP element-mobilizing transposase RayT
MAHTFTNLLTHVIFSTKDRLSQIDGDLKAQLYPYMVGILRELDGKTSIVSGTPDHVHLLVQLPPILALSDAMRILKTNSSKWVHDRWPVRSKLPGKQDTEHSASANRTPMRFTDTYPIKRNTTGRRRFRRSFWST